MGGEKKQKQKLSSKMCFFALRKHTEPGHKQKFDTLTRCRSSSFFLSVLTGVKCWNPDWLRWIFVKISKRKAHVLWGRFTAIITERSRLHLPHANWWQANQQHALKTTVPLCWHCCRSLTASPPLFLISLCPSAFFSPPLWPHLSLFLFHLFIFCNFITFPFFLSFCSWAFLFSPPTLVPTPPLPFSHSSLHPRPCGPGEVAGWQKPDPLVLQVSYLTYEVTLCMCLSVCVSLCRVWFVRAGHCSRGQSEVWEDDALDTLWGRSEGSGERDFQRVGGR